MNERAEGFYWVRFGGGPPLVALWDGAVWWVAGVGECYVPAEVAVLAGPLTPPDGEGA